MAKNGSAILRSRTKDTKRQIIAQRQLPDLLKRVAELEKKLGLKQKRAQARNNFSSRPSFSFPLAQDHAKITGVTIRMHARLLTMPPMIGARPADASLPNPPARST